MVPPSYAGNSPVISFVGNYWEHDIIGELKWLAELDTTNRLQGDTIWFKLVAKF